MVFAREAGAQGNEETSVPLASQGQTVGRTSERVLVTLKVHSEGPQVTEESLRLAIANELGTTVVLGETDTVASNGRAVIVAYDPSRRELAVSVRSSGRANTTRVVEAPAKAEEVITVAALLASTLVRDSLAETDGVAAEEPRAAAAAESVPALAASAAVVPEKTPAPRPPARAIAVAALFYPLATNLDKPDVHTHLSFNLLYGRVGAVEGIELGLVNTVSETVRGVEIAGLTNWVDGDFDGLQIGGVYNGATNMKGVGLTFGVNHARGTRQGGQIAGVANLTEGNVSGLSAVLGLNWARRVEGVQFAGVANVSRGAFDGLEVAPFNYAQNVSGVQVGLINVASKVRGVQLGLINVADDVEGVPIGVISVTRTGGVHPMFWAGTATPANVGIKFATRYTYTFLNVSGKEVDDQLRIGPGLGFGGSVPLLPALFFEPDLGVTHLIGATDCCAAGEFSAVERRRDETLIRLRGALRYSFVKHFSLFAGAAVVGRVTYPLDGEGNTEYRVRSLVEGFGGVEL